MLTFCDVVVMKNNKSLENSCKSCNGCIYGSCGRKEPQDIEMDTMNDNGERIPKEEEPVSDYVKERREVLRQYYLKTEKDGKSLIIHDICTLHLINTKCTLDGLQFVLIIVNKVQLSITI